jgi:hypothetical protein
MRSILGVAAVLAIGSASAYLVHRACSLDAVSTTPSALPELQSRPCCPLSSQQAPSCCDEPAPDCCPAQADGATCPAAGTCPKAQGGAAALPGPAETPLD